MGKLGHQDWPHGNKGKGKTVAFLRDNVNFDGPDCLIWPFCRKETGYGQFGYLGQRQTAHRFMCELVNGPPPTPKHEAAHSCGKGHEGCVHPKHLSWKTMSENQLDRRRHGTSSPKGRLRYKLTPEQVIEIRRLLKTEKQAVIAKRFGISRGNVYLIKSGTTWPALAGGERQ